MEGPGGVANFGIHPIPSEDLIKQIRLNTIKTRAGRIAYLLLLGENAALGGIHNGVKPAEGALKHIARILKERSKE